jgi:hypothetical protein
MANAIGIIDMQNQTTGYYRVQLTEWINSYYTGKTKPSRQTIVRRLENGELPGSKKTGSWVIYCDQHYEPVFVENTPKQQPSNRFALHLISETQHGT